MSELSDIYTENLATTRSPTDKTMMVGMTEKPATFSSFSERVKKTLGNFFPFTMGTGTGDEAETQEEEENDDEQDDFGSQVSLNSSTQENDAYTDRETGTMDQFGVVRTISKTTNGSGQSGDFVNTTNSEVRTSKNRNTGLCDAPADPEVDHEKTSRQRIKTRVSTSTKLPGTNRATPPLVTPLVDNGASIEEALTNIVGSIGEQTRHSRDATSRATAIEPLNRSLETFLTRLSRTNERSEKSRRVFKKPRCYKDESDGCIDTWMEVMKLHFEEEDLSERQECSALTSNLEGTALKKVMAKKQYDGILMRKSFKSC